MPSSGRASPSLRWAWTKKQRKHKLKPVLGLTPNVVQKVEPGHYRGYDVSLAFIPFIVGVVLFWNGRQWAVALARRQTESSAPATTVSESHESDT